MKNVLAILTFAISLMATYAFGETIENTYLFGSYFGEVFTGVGLVGSMFIMPSGILMDGFFDFSQLAFTDDEIKAIGEAIIEAEFELIDM